MAFPRVLHGVRVVDLSTSLAGPFAAQVLADLGADVIKVERPGSGDPARAWAPPAWGGDGTLFLASNRGKRSVALDLGSGGGRDHLDALLSGADVLVHAFRPDVARRFGLSEGRLRGRFPRLVLCEIVAFNPGTSRAERPGYDPLLQAHAGLMSVTGPEGGPPMRVGTSVVDLGAGTWGALGVLAALRHRDQSGKGSHVRVSLEDTALTWMGYHLQGAEASGAAPAPMGTGLGMIVPYGTFPTRGGRLVIAAGTDALFRRLCAALGLERLAADPRFATNPGRVAHRAQVEGAISGATGSRGTDELERILVQAGVPCAPIRDALEVASDPEVRDGPFRAEPNPRIPGYRAVALPVVIDGERAPFTRPPPALEEPGGEVSWGGAPEAGQPGGRGIPDRPNDPERSELPDHPGDPGGPDHPVDPGGPVDRDQPDDPDHRRPPPATGR